MQLSCKLGLRPPAVLALGLLTAVAPIPAHALVQVAVLTLGQYGSATVSGTATLTDTGTIASGTYTYNPVATGTPLDSQNSYYAINEYGPSTVNVSGGSIGSLSTDNTSTANVSGGSIYDLLTDESSTANVSGGTFTYIQTLDISTASVSGGSINHLSTTFLSTIDLLGTGFSETFVGNNQSSGYKQYNVTGTLQDGTPIAAEYDASGGTLEFNGTSAVPGAAPEPSQFAALSFAAFGLLGLILKAHAKQRDEGKRRPLA